MTNPTPIRRRWVGVEYVEDVTGFSRWTIYKMARDGRIPAQRKGRSVRFDPDAINAWMSKAPRASA